MGSAPVLVDGHYLMGNDLIDGRKQEEDTYDARSTAVTVPTHPLGIKPAGNIYTSVYNLKSAAGYFAYLPDELIVEILEYLDGRSLLQLEATCKALYAFTRFEDLWRTLFIEYVQKISYMFHSSSSSCTRYKVRLLFKDVLMLLLPVKSFTRKPVVTALYM